jgi:hypothetical protein
MWRGVVFLVLHSSAILVKGVQLSSSCNMLDTRYNILVDTSYHRKVIYLTPYYRSAQSYKLSILPVIRLFKYPILL